MDPRARRATHALTSLALAASMVAAGSSAGAVTPANIGFDPPVTLETGSDVTAVTLADVVGDDGLDLVASTGGSGSEPTDRTLQVFERQAGGTLSASPVTHTPTGDASGSPSLITASGDLDGDGDADMAAGTAQGVDVFLQGADGLGAPTNLPAAGGEVLDVQVADLNADGRDDLVSTVDVADSADVQVARRSQGEGGAFADEEILGTFAGGDRIAVGDVTGEGRLDVVVADGPADGLDVLTQAADGSFSATTIAAPAPVRAASFADVTGDGIDDLVTLDADGSSLRVIGVTAAGPDADPAVYGTATASPALSIETADLNGDGATDVAVLSGAGTALWLQDDAGVLSGPCAAPTPLPVGATGGREITAAGDVDGDDVVDLIGGGGRTGAGVMTGFAPGETYPTTLTLDALPVQVTVGASITVTGSLSHDHGCLEPGAQVEIWRATGAAAATKLATVDLDGLDFSYTDPTPVAGTHHYHAVFSGGGVLGADESGVGTVVVAKKTASVGFTVSDPSVRFGESITLTATLNGATTGRIDFWAKVGTAAPRLVGSANVNAQRKASLVVQPRHHTRYYATYPGSATFAQATSKEVTVTVAAVVSGEMTKYVKKVDGVAVYRCCRAWLRTWVRPSKPGQFVKVRVEYWNGARWIYLGAAKDTFKLDPDGSALIWFDIAGGAGFRYRTRATWATDGLNSGGSSPWVHFKLV